MNIKYTSTCGCHTHTDRIQLRWWISGYVGFPLVINITQHTRCAGAVVNAAARNISECVFIPTGILVHSSSASIIWCVSWSLYCCWYPAPNELSTNRLGVLCMCVDSSERLFAQQKNGWISTGLDVGNRIAPYVWVASGYFFSMAWTDVPTWVYLMLLWRSFGIPPVQFERCGIFLTEKNTKPLCKYLCICCIAMVQ